MTAEHHHHFEDAGTALLFSKDEPEQMVKLLIFYLAVFEQKLARLLGYGFLFELIFRNDMFQDEPQIVQNRFVFSKVFKLVVGNYIFSNLSVGSKDCPEVFESFFTWVRELAFFEEVVTLVDVRITGDSIMNDFPNQ